jgi:anti-sigma-K factor RskA
LRKLLTAMENSTPPIPTDAKAHYVTSWWRALAIFLSVVLLLCIATGASMFEQFKAQLEHVQAQLQTVPQVRYLSVLLDDQHQPAMLVTQSSTQSVLQVQRLNTVSEGREDSMQLWAVGGDGRAHSLGVLESRGQTLQLHSSESALRSATQLAISVEDKGGVSDARGPRKPFLFTGALVQKAQ